MRSKQPSRRPCALVTGGSRRVGRAVALALAQAGCDVAITFRSSRPEAESVCREIEAFGAVGRPIRADFSKPAAAARAITDALGRRGLDVLVLNAALYERDRASSLASIQQAREHLVVNAVAPLAIARALAPRLARSGMPGGGSIVAMGDIHALGRPRSQWINYLASKGALQAGMEALAVALAPTVRVNLVAPGLVAAAEGESSGAVERYIRTVPMGRAGTPDDAAGAVVWLALHAPYVTGQTIRVDGGRWLR